MNGRNFREDGAGGPGVAHHVLPERQGPETVERVERQGDVVRDEGREVVEVPPRPARPGSYDSRPPLRVSTEPGRSKEREAHTNAHTRAHRHQNVNLSFADEETASLLPVREGRPQEPLGS